MGAYVGGFEGWDDVGFGGTWGDGGFGDAVFDFVALNPDFAADDVDEADVGDGHIAVVGVVKDELADESPHF